MPPVTAATRVDYDACRCLVRELWLGGAEAFREWSKQNTEKRQKLGIPSDPYGAYTGDGWTNWGHFLGS